MTRVPVRLMISFKHIQNLYKGFIAPLLLAIIVILLIGGGVYICQHNKQSNSLVDNPNVQASSTSAVASSTTTIANVRFAIDLPGDTKNVTGNFIPFEMDMSGLQPPEYPAMGGVRGINVAIMRVGSSTPTYTFSFQKGTTYASTLFLPSDLANGLYTLEASSTNPELATCCSKPSAEDMAAYEKQYNEAAPPVRLYDTRILINRKVADSSAILASLLYPVVNGKPQYINTDTLDLRGAAPLLAFEVSNKSNEIAHVRALHLSDDQDTSFAYIKSFSSIYDVDNKKDISSISPLFDVTQGYYQDNSNRTIYLNIPVDVAPGATRKIALLGVLNSEFLKTSNYYSHGGYFPFFITEIIGDIGGAVFTKETPSLQTGIVSEQLNSVVASTTPAQ